MKRFILSRLISGMVVILVVLTGVFLLVRLTGNPGDALLPNFATEKEYQMLSKELGLDKPIYVQYWIFIKKLAIGDFGVSAGARLPVRDMLLQRMPNSLKLGAVSMLMVILGSFPLGVIAALKRGKLFDWVARIIVAIGQSVPSYVVGLFLMQLFSIHLRLFPVARMEGFSSYILPVSSSIFVGGGAPLPGIPPGAPPIGGLACGGLAPCGGIPIFPPTVAFCACDLTAANSFSTGSCGPTP